MDTTQKFAAISLDEKVIASISKNKKVVAKLGAIVDMAGGKADKQQGNLLYALSTKIPPTLDQFTKSFVDCIMQNKWAKVQQLEEGIIHVKEQLASIGDSYKIEGATQAAFEKASGVGINVTEKDVEKLIQDAFAKYKADIDELKYDFQWNKINYYIKDTNKWADGKTVKTKLEEAQLALLGERPAKTEGKKPKGNKMSTEDKKKLKVSAANLADKDTPATTGKDIMDLIGRDCNIGANAGAILKAHQDFAQGRMITRFPPEPNGYLHIGHAKAIRFNFTVAAENNGVTYLRFDDTNPCKENHEFIDHIKKNVAWLGYKPWKVTASSDYFDKLYEIAIDLIKKGRAYVCHQSGKEMSESREKRTDSPYRKRSVEENLKLFEAMRQGRMDEGECSLRVKMDMQHDNPNMRDFVAYRIRFVEHPMSGDKWCIYPTYDYTHCLVDSLENITHSLCTLEFEIRRESYYRLLQDCEIYKPYVWEYSRLNISNTVLSKRKIETLVNKGLVSGWNDPRLLTLEGLRRRGYTPSMINDFCAHCGVSRKGNENITSIKLLEKFARTELDAKSPRTFGVMDPVLVEIVNFEAAKETKFEAPLFPADPTKGTQTYTLTKNVYIESEDFSAEHIDKFFGLTPQQPVMLKYGPVIKLISVERNGDDSINHVKVEILPDHKEKLKGYIQWVAKEHSLTVTANLYAVHFTVEDVKKVEDEKDKEKWLRYINPDSLIVKSNAKMWNMHRKNKVDDRFQFERCGYFVIDEGSNPGKNKITLNRIVALKEDKAKAENTSNAKK